jgi:hypothetical protein
MALRIANSIAQVGHGRGRNKTFALVDQRGDKRWLVTVEFSRRRNVWLVRSGGPLARDRVVGSKATFEEVEYLAHQLAPLARDGKL